MSEETLRIFETLSSKQPFLIDPSSLLGGNNTVIMADPRKGKSYTAAKVCEELGNIGIPYIIIDPEGEYYSLREKFSVLVAGVQKIENCDLTVGVEHAELLVNQVLESRVSLIFDLSSPDVEEDVIHQFLAEFMRILIQEESRVQIPLLVVVDEADEYIPERGHKTRGLDYEQFGKLVKKGGKRGIGTIIVSHRPSWVAKDLLAKCQNWILMNQRYKDDLERLEDLTRIPLSVLMKLKERDLGEALLYGAITNDQIVWAKCLPRLTTHIGTTPNVKPKFVKRPELEGILEKFRIQLEQLTVTRAAERSEIERLESELSNAERESEKKDEEIKMLKTARMAADMVQPKDAISKIVGGPPLVVSFEDYDKVRQRLKDIEGELEKVKSNNVKASTLFWIDEYGSFHSEFPWLARLIDLSRVKAIIVKHLMENKASTAESIALNYGFTTDTIREHLNELLKKGVVLRQQSRPFKYFLRES